jgi:type IV pilus assembly protein PilE
MLSLSTGAKMIQFIKIRDTMKKQTGFTLIELMVVVAIIGIIAGFAIPSYQNNVEATSRKTAMNELLSVMAAQEDYSANNATYAATLAALNFSNPYDVANNSYRISIGVCPGVLISSCVLLTATPINNQGGGPLTLNSRGVRTQNGANGWTR